MSLLQLRDLRRSGKRPAQVTVLIGRPCKSFDDGPGYVTVTDPAADFSPLVGLPVHVLDLQGDADVTLRTISALEALDVTPMGICGPAGSCGVSREHEQAMHSLREVLCAK